MRINHPLPYRANQKIPINVKRIPVEKRRRRKREKEREKNIPRWTGAEEHGALFSRLIWRGRDKSWPGSSSAHPRLSFRCFLLVSPGLSIFHLAGFTFGRRHRRPVLSFDDRSRGCSQLQLQFPGSPAPERSAAISLSLSLSFLLHLLFISSTFPSSPFLLHPSACVYVLPRTYAAVQVCAHTPGTCRTSPWRHVKDPPWTRDRPDFRVRLPVPATTNVRHDVDLLNAPRRRRRRRAYIITYLPVYTRECLQLS